MTPGGHRDPRARPSSRIVVVVGVAGALAGLVLAFLLYQRFGQRGVAFAARGFVVESDRLVRVEFEVAKDAGATAVCRVRSRGRGGAEVGGELVTIGPAATSRTIVEHPLATTGRANTGEVTGCVLR